MGNYVFLEVNAISKFIWPHFVGCFMCMGARVRMNVVKTHTPHITKDIKETCYFFTGLKRSLDYLWIFF